MIKHLAMFIDGENIAPRYGGCIASACKELGPTALKRVYGDITRMPGWASMQGLRAIHTAPGNKNAADIQIVIDAMEFSFDFPEATFVLVSSDGDFGQLARRLRERGHLVVGVGERHASPAFRLACSDFRYVGPPVTNGAAVPMPALADLVGTGSTQTEYSLDRQIQRVIAKHSRNGTGMALAKLASELRTNHGVTISRTAERRWRPYLAARPELYDLDPKGPDAHVRFRSEGFAKLPL